MRLWLIVSGAAPIAFAGAAANLAPVTIDNSLGGTLLVALVYWSVYLRRDRAAKPEPGVS
jgi:formate transporter